MTRFAAPIAEQIWDMKYRFKSAQGTPVDVTIEDTWRRIATDLSQVEQTPEIWAEKFYAALEDFKFLPAGRITAGAGTARKVTLFNCFVMGTIPDDMAGIFDMLREAALTMQQGVGSAMILARSGPVEQMSKAWLPTPAGRYRSWTFGMQCVARS